MRAPKHKEDDGHLRESYYHACIQGDKVRLQINSGDVLYISRPQDLKALASWLLKAAEYLKETK